LNALSGATAVIGGVAGYFALTHAAESVPYVLAFSAASFIYIAVADLIPELHRRWDFADAVLQIVLIGAGVATLHVVH
jgi:zinc and cadmium transporter